MRYFKAIAAMSENRVIGQGGRIPWHLPEDFKWFKKTTTGNVIVMGRKTYESIGRPLPNRVTVVVSKSGWNSEGVRVIQDLLQEPWTAEPREVFICGGAQIYALALPYCSDIYMTHVKRVVEGDVFFPPFEAQFEPAETMADNADFRIVHYINRSPVALA